MRLPLGDKRKPLYCVSYEVWTGTEWKANLLYMHATDSFEARGNFAAGMPANFQVGINVHIAAIAPVVGGFAEDEHADRIIL